MLLNRLNNLIFSIAAASDLLQAVLSVSLILWWGISGKHCHFLQGG